ncbi:MAG: hypothetical protein ACXVJ7_03750 [Acidimicrobiia bacterium]
MDIAQLPYIDEHAVDIAAGAEDLWPVLLEGIEHSFCHRGASIYARAIRCDESEAAGPRPITRGSAVPGFRVSTATPGSLLVLEGHHRFSSYALTFRLEALGADHTRLHAETRAAFPGVAGRLYRLVVIGTGGHVVAVRRLLAGIQRRAEVRPASAA